MLVRPKALLDYAEKLEHAQRELDSLSSDIASVSRRLGQSSGMEEIRRLLLQHCRALDSGGVFVHKQGQTLIQAVRWYSTCETRIQDEYEDSVIRFPYRESAAIDVSFVSSILQ